MIKRIYSAMLSFVLIFLLMFSNVSIQASAQEDPMIVVSFGDSYSSGEGIEKFYGQDKSLADKVSDHDWLAHRSQNSWPGQIKIPGYAGTMKDYRQTSSSTADVQWYFAASSGAVSSNIYSTSQEKKYDKTGLIHTYKDTVYLPKQTAILDNVNGQVDYVTMSIGGNDVDFAGIITTCAKGSTYLGSKSLENKLSDLWSKIDDTMGDLKTCYQNVESAVGSQAAIVVAGYPELLDYNGKGALFSQAECNMVNEKVRAFNDKIEGLITDCQGEGMNIHFADVEGKFRGHQAYSSDAWIHGIKLATFQDLDDWNPISAYSMHPTARGAQAYAEAVNDVIESIENNKNNGSLSGKVCLASNRVTPVPLALVNANSENNGRKGWKLTDANGTYSMNIPEDSYKVEIKALGFIPFVAYANVTAEQNTYMETFLLVAGEEGERGIAKGKITNALTGVGVPDANIEVRTGWNNSSRGDVLSTSATNENGDYELDLPLGNYTLTVSKSGFITGTVNIIVQRDLTENQNGSISPIGTGEDFRIVLTWGENPRDLDSHVVGPMSNGNTFHVYYAHKSQYDGSVEVCNLDVDDVTSYGPETITLKTSETDPYYYYIHHYAGTGTISTSEATIKVYQGSEFIAKFNVPTDLGSGIYWNVFAIVNGQLVVKNTMTNSPDVSYAGSNLRTSLRMAPMSLNLIDDFLNGKEKLEDKDALEVKELEPKEEVLAEEVVEEAEEAEEKETDSAETDTTDETAADVETPTETESPEETATENNSEETPAQASEDAEDATEGITDEASVSDEEVSDDTTSTDGGTSDESNDNSSQAEPVIGETTGDEG